MKNIFTSDYPAPPRETINQGGFMKKPYGHTVLSDVVCDEQGCKARIKMNLVMRKTSGRRLKCYQHFIYRKRLDQNKHRGDHAAAE